MTAGATARRRRGRAWPAWLAVVALLVQALIPAAALAHARAGDPVQITLCTREGLKLVTVDAGAGKAAAASPISKPKGFAGLPCLECVMACCAAVETTAPDAAAPVRYAAPAFVLTPFALVGTPGARAPPRPPSQGPDRKSVV